MSAAPNFGNVFAQKPINVSKQNFRCYRLFFVDQKGCFTPSGIEPECRKSAIWALGLTSKVGHI